MPIEIKKGILNVKDSNGNYIGLDVVAQETTDAAITRIEEKRDEVLTEISSVSELSDMIASEFNQSTSYKKGDYVIKSNESDVNQLFRFTQNHTGAWTGADVVQVVITQDLNKTETNIAPIEMTNIATEAHNAGAYFIHNGKLVKATVNIAIGDPIVTTGTGANCKEVSGGLGGEVTSLWFASNQLKDLHGLVDYNNKSPYHKVYNSSTYTGYIDRSGTRFVFNGTFVPSATGARVIANNSIEAIIYTSTVPSTSTTYALKLTNGHIYRARMREISGEKTNTVAIRINKAGAVSVAAGNAYTDKLSGDSICDFTYDSDAFPNGINIIIFVTRTSTGNTLTNYTVDVTLEDITDGANDQIYTDVAPAELETATENHVVGDLIICKNQLYEVTAAIAAGETITPGTNVSATTIAAQLAAIKAQLANI